MKLQLRSRRTPARVARGAPRRVVAPETVEQNRQAVAHALGHAVQPKLVLGRTDDPQEAQADRVAAQVMGAATTERVATSPERVQRECKECEEEEQRKKKPQEETPVQRLAVDAAPSAGAGVVPAQVASGIGTARSSGSPMPPGERSFFEPRFGASFSQVRVHADAQSAQLAQSIHARAFTVGQHIFFGAGEYTPGLDSGRHLLAHELTHTLQQGGGDARLQRSPESDLDDMDMAAEREYNKGGAPKAVKGAPPPGCSPGFCDPYPHEKYARYQLAKQRGPLLLGIAAAVNSRVAKLWAQHLSGGAPPQDLSGEFGADFSASPTTAKTSGFLMDSLRKQLKLSPPPVSAANPVWAGSLKSLIGAAIAELDDPNGANQMNFNHPRDTPGNLAGGIGKDQTSNKVGAQPSPFNDQRLADGVVTVIRDPKSGQLSVFPVINYTVRDTIDLCPGDCGTALESIATVPISQFEATGIAGDVPYTVNFTVVPATFTLPGKKP